MEQNKGEYENLEQLLGDFDDSKSAEDILEQDKINKPRVVKNSNEKKKSKKRKKKRKKFNIIPLAIIVGIIVVAIVIYSLFFKPKTYKISFYDQEGNELGVVSVQENKCADFISAPEKSGLKFQGWYVDGDQTKLFEDTTPITSDLKLVAFYDSYTKVKKISFENKSYSLKIGQTLDLKVTVSPEDATGSLVLSSSDTSIATVDQNGHVVAIEEGSATITAQIDNQKATCKINVSYPYVTTITLDPEAIVFDLNDSNDKSKKISVSLQPSDAKKDVTFSSSKPTVAEVDENGTVKPLSVGNTSITVKAYGGLRKSVSVSVIKSATKIVFTDGGSYLMSVGGDVLKLEEKLSFTPEDSRDSYLNNALITWESSDTSVATVSQSGVVTAIKGSANPVTIKAICKAKDKEIIAECKIYVSGSVLTVEGFDDEVILKAGESINYSGMIKFITYTGKGVIDNIQDVSSSATLVSGNKNMIAQETGSTVLKVVPDKVSADVNKIEIKFTYYDEVSQKTYSSEKHYVSVQKDEEEIVEEETQGEGN